MSVEHFYDKKQHIWTIKAVGLEGENKGHLYYLEKESELRLC